MKKYWWLVLLLVVGGIQLIRPGMVNPPVNPDNDLKAVAAPPAEVYSLLQAACYDCHSNETKHPWYAQIAPVSWWINNHVQEGREAVNFSEFALLSAKDRAEALDESAEKIREGEMPLQSFLWMHPEARLTPEQKDMLAQWLEQNGGGGSEASGSEGEKGEGEEDD